MRLEEAKILRPRNHCRYRGEVYNMQRSSQRKLDKKIINTDRAFNIIKGIYGSAAVHIFVLVLILMIVPIGDVANADGMHKKVNINNIDDLIDIQKEITKELYSDIQMIFDENVSITGGCLAQISAICGREETATGPLCMVALDYASIETVVSHTRYPQNVWRHILNMLRERDFNTIKETMYKNSDEKKDFTYNTLKKSESAIAETLNNYREKSDTKSLPKMTVDEPCGDNSPIWNESVIKTNPVGGIVRYIPYFFFRLCNKYNVDPYDQSRCDYWNSVLDGETHLFVGRYSYEASWPTGNIRRDQFEITSPPKNDILIFSQKNK